MKTDLEFTKLLKEVIDEFHFRIGKEMCKELHIDCPDCQARICIGILNGWIDTLEWAENKKSPFAHIPWQHRIKAKICLKLSVFFWNLSQYFNK